MLSGHFTVRPQAAQFESQLNPLFSVLEALARDGIEAAEEGASHTSIEAVINTDFICRDDLVPGASGHR
jgi:hypothetical protein